jgi:hypothetical protein
MIKRIIGLIVFLLAANAGIRVALVYFHDQQFTDGVRELSLFSGNKSEELVRSKVMELAVQNQIPIDPDFIEITKKSVPGMGDHAVIKVSYAVMVPVFPGNLRRFQFDYITP